MAKRKKLSTTVSPEGYAFLRRLTRSGRAESLAQAVDIVVDEVQRTDNRERLERATAEYFQNRSQDEIAEDAALEEALCQASAKVDFDEEPDAGQRSNLDRQSDAGRAAPLGSGGLTRQQKSE
jgi:hypothetical protein